MDKPLFATIMPFRAHDVSFMISEYRRFSDSTKLTLLLPSMTLHPEGQDPYEKADLCISSFRELKEGLAGTPIRLGVLLQTLMGHGWAGSNIESTGFQTTVNHSGETRGRYCPLGEEFRRYCCYVVTSLAKLGPEMFLLDDDTRLIDNDKVECFCPLHMAAYFPDYDRDRLIRDVLAARPGDAILVRFERARRDSLEGFVRFIRESIDSVNPLIPCGVSGSGREQNMFERLGVAAAGEHTTPFVRVGNALYFEPLAKELPRRLYQTMVQVKGCGRVRVVLDEADTFPHNRYSKSAVGMLSHLTGGLLHGLQGGKLWISNFLHPQGDPNVKFERIMGDYSGFFKALVDSMEGIKWQGITVPLPDLEKNFHPRDYPQYFTCKEWFSDALGKMGFPCTFMNADDPHGEAFVLSGELVEELTEGDVEHLFGKNLFLDAVAAEKLFKRGYGPLMGLKAIGPCLQFSGESVCVTGEPLRLLPGPDCRLLEPVWGAEIMTTLRFKSNCMAARADVVAPGTVCYRNARGRTVIVWAGFLDVYITSPGRRRWLKLILDRLVKMDAVCANEQDVLCRTGRLRNGMLLVGVINLGYDVLEQLVLETSGVPDQIQCLTPVGEWSEVSFTCQEGKTRVDCACGAYCPVILRLKM